MKKYFPFFFVFQLLIFIHSAHGGWPEDGWFATSDLNFSHRGVSLKFNDLHHDLATQERDLSRMLPQGNTTNIVLAEISLLVGGELKTYPIMGPNKHLCVFESGWESSFRDDPTLDLAESSVNKHAPPQRKGELTPDAKLALVNDFEDIVRLRRHFQDHIRHHCGFAGASF